MSFLDGKPRVATAEDIAAPWCGEPDGKMFRCHMCGHRFVVGEVWRCVYTNDLGARYGGNPLVCTECDRPHGGGVVRRWKALCDEAYADRFWWFMRRES